MGKNYLVALDGSENSDYALLWALENLVDLNNGRLLILSVGLLSWGASFEYSAVTRNILNGENEEKIQKQQAERKAEDIVNNGKKLVTEFLAIKKAELPLELYFNSSTDPANYILDFIREQRIDVLVLGSRGKISQHCLQFASCTVVIARKKNSHKFDVK
ncbi:universal stress protein a-like protein [Gigaspora margarita]|uniref:Universal stress protein a-like protein n=1 Tax=Gigaspora margarita TaxID=4874 RepID=A0A8H3XGN6_GIGMA|nr:universal stress protein a-like protein [Gigaspora margarita]